MMARNGIGRRDFLGMLAGLCAAMVPGVGLATNQSGPLFYSAVDDLEGRHFLMALDGTGVIRFRVQTRFRGHSLALDQQGGRILMFARRPGRFFCIADAGTGEMSQEVPAPAGRHFYGHGVFSADGHTLFTSENDYDHARGVIGVWDVSGEPLRMGEVSAHGLGPHDIRLMPDGERLVVANGGIETHPDYGRRKLNIPSMDPSLTYLSVRDGALLEQQRLEDHLLSIRHLWVARDGQVSVALQEQGVHRSRVGSKPVMAMHKPGKSALQMLDAPSEVWKGFAGYIASTCIAEQAQVIAATSPRGDQIGFWQRDSGAFLSTLPMPDVSGLCLDPGGQYFVATSGRGQVRYVDHQTLQWAEGLGSDHPDQRWDNHLVLA